MLNPSSARIGLTFFLSVFAAVGGLAAAAPADDLWTDVLAARSAQKAWSAVTIEQKISLVRERAVPETFSQLQTKVGRKDNKPVYETHSPDPDRTAKARKLIELGGRLAEVEEELFSAQAKVRRVADAGDDKSVLAVFEVQSENGKMKAYVHPRTARLSRTEISVSVPLLFDGRSIRTYVDVQGKTALPVASETELQVNIPFRKASLKISETYGQWSRTQDDPAR